jgi:hypothetical protein
MLNDGKKTPYTQPSACHTLIGDVDIKRSIANINNNDDNKLIILEELIKNDNEPTSVYFNYGDSNIIFDTFKNFIIQNKDTKIIFDNKDIYTFILHSKQVNVNSYLIAYIEYCGTFSFLLEIKKDFDLRVIIKETIEKLKKEEKHIAIIATLTNSTADEKIGINFNKEVRVGFVDDPKKFSNTVIYDKSDDTKIKDKFDSTDYVSCKTYLRDIGNKVIQQNQSAYKQKSKEEIATLNKTIEENKLQYESKIGELQTNIDKKDENAILVEANTAKQNAEEQIQLAEEQIRLAEEQIQLANNNSSGYIENINNASNPAGQAKKFAETALKYIENFLIIYNKTLSNNTNINTNYNIKKIISEVNSIKNKAEEIQKNADNILINIENDNNEETIIQKINDININNYDETSMNNLFNLLAEIYTKINEEKNEEEKQKLFNKNMNIVNNLKSKLENVKYEINFQKLKSKYPILIFLFEIIEKSRPQIEQIRSSESDVEKKSNIIINQTVDNEKQLNNVSNIIKQSKNNQNQEKYNNKNGSFVKKQISDIDEKVDKTTQIKNLKNTIEDMTKNFNTLSGTKKVENQLTFNGKIAKLNKKLAELEIERKPLYNRGGSRKNRKNLSKKNIPSNLNNRHTRKSKPSHTKTRKRHP